MASLFRVFGTVVKSQSFVKSPRVQPLIIGATSLVFVRGKARKTLKDPPDDQKRQKLRKKRRTTANVVEEDPDVKYEGRVPQDDVWVKKYYPTPRYSLLEAVAMHREAAVPEIQNNEKGILVLNSDLDLRLKKKTKFMKEFTHTVVLPHFFDDGTVHRLLVFCKSPEDKTTAIALGAEFAGGLDLVKSIMKGEIKHDDYDHCICTADIYQEISVLRKHLRERFPSPKAGTVGGDVTTMFRFFTEGKTFESRNEEEKVGKLQAHFATLSMTDQQIQENYETFLEEICSLKSPSLGQFVINGTLMCPPSREQFVIHKKDLLPKSQRDTEETQFEEDEEPLPKPEDEEDIQAQVAAK